MPSPSPVPDDLSAIQTLVQGFRANLAQLRDPQTSEAVVRQEFIDPFWSALGWDVTNRAHRTAAEKDVVVEPTIGTLEGQQLRSRRPDYLFRIDGFPRFIVEAKKPAIDLATDRDAIFQAKTYAWSAQIPFAILTDFEEFRLFDATIKPYHNEPDRGVVPDFDLRFEDYLAQWDVLLSTFGREAVANGSLERLLARIKRVRAGRRIRGIDRMLIDLRGSEPVDKVFLAHLQDYRLRFAREIYRTNRSDFPNASTRSGAARLTEAVQRLLDRLVFIRVCEDRDISPYGDLRANLNRAARERLDLYPLLVNEFRELDRQYNGYLFKAHFTEALSVPADLLAEFIRSLYMPDGPYRFDAIGDDLLGIIYERFLGSVITVHRNQVAAADKPEVRHAGGVYYTPRFVVDTIVRRALGPKLAGCAPLDVLNLRILDPACGSGTFLIAAFEYLIDHCQTYIGEHPGSESIPATPRARTRRRPIAFQDEDGQWLLAPDFKSQLLTSCLHGVDIDAQAVEVTIMSLYLKMLEGKLPPNWQRDWLESQLLPPLDNNIRCGNSLLSQADFDRWWDNTYANLFAGDQDVRFRINAFDWTSHTRGFGRLLEARQGFDCIVGNPPYIRVQELKKWAPDECEFYKSRYKSAARGNYDIYVVFIERALELLAPAGLVGFICPHKFWQAAYGQGLRKLIADGKHLRSVIDFTDQQVFRGSTNYTAIQVFSKDANDRNVDYARVTDLQDGEAQCRALDMAATFTGVDRYDADQPSTPEAWVFVTATAAALMSAMRDQARPLGEVATKIFVGLQTSADDVFILQADGRRFYSTALAQSFDLESDLLHPLLKGSVHIRRWVPDQTNRFVLFPYTIEGNHGSLIQAKVFQESYPRTWAYLAACRQRLSARERGTFGGEGWYGYVYPKNLREMGKPKLLTPSLGRKAEFCLDPNGEFHFVGSGGGGGGGYGILVPGDVRPLYLLGLLNSRLLDWFLKQITTKFHSGWYAYNKQYIEQLPIRLPETADEKRIANEISERVRQIIDAKKRLQSSRPADHERERLDRQVEAHEARIDELVLRLYSVDSIPD